MGHAFAWCSHATVLLQSLFIPLFHFHPRGTVLDEGKLAPADTWDFTPGDVWYFPSNTAHSLLGLPPSGCTYVTGYNHPSFEEHADSFSASSWFATLPAEVLAQGSGLDIEAVGQLQEGLGAGEGSFIPQGQLPVVVKQQVPSIQQQFPRKIHRFPSAQNVHAVRQGTLVEGSANIGTLEIIHPSLFFATA